MKQIVVHVHSSTTCSLIIPSVRRQALLQVSFPKHVNAVPVFQNISIQHKASIFPNYEEEYSSLLLCCTRTLTSCARSKDSLIRSSICDSLPISRAGLRGKICTIWAPNCHGFAITQQKFPVQNIWYFDDGLVQRPVL